MRPEHHHDAAYQRRRTRRVQHRRIPAPPEHRRMHATPLPDVSLRVAGSAAQGAARRRHRVSAPYVAWYGKDRVQTWRTPPEFFAKLHSRFSFTLDGAATEE